MCRPPPRLLLSVVACWPELEREKVAVNFSFHFSECCPTLREDSVVTCPDYHISMPSTRALCVFFHLYTVYILWLYHICIKLSRLTILIHLCGFRTTLPLSPTWQNCKIGPLGQSFHSAHKAYKKLPVGSNIFSDHPMVLLTLVNQDISIEVCDTLITSILNVYLSKWNYFKM